MADFNDRMRALAERIDALSVRERGLIFIGAMAVLYLVGFSAIFQPLNAEYKRLDQTVQENYRQVEAADTQIKALVSGEEQGNAESRARIEALVQQMRTLDDEMDRMTAGVVSPKEMAKLLEQMLARNRNLELLRLEALKPAPIDEVKKAVGDVLPVLGDAVMYRHGMRIEFSGRYADILDYLQTLERLPWKVYWGEVTLETDKYPISKVSLVIYTLSRSPTWIGV
jgi:MSHA biogenesis protein MshJ